MTSGFNNDQFYGAERTGETRLTDGGNGNWVGAGADNPPFKFPGNTVRTQDRSGKVVNTKLQRGYIRTLMTESEGTALKIAKCAFQFNPSTLNTSVAMSENMLNMMQQDIGQYSVPIAANVNFGFTMDFDRSMELNEASGLNGTNSPDSADNMLGNLNPNQVGVLRDIAALNSVVGVGITQTSMAYAQKIAVDQIHAQNTALGEGADSAKMDKAVANVPNIIGSVNFGNTAFLQPVPVRIVFSSLFIVEGFVSNMAILYAKFTTAMVPMAARVDIQMTATYIGYAKKNTFTTASLKAQATEWKENQAAVMAKTVNLQADLAEAFNSIDVGLLVGKNVTTVSTLARQKGTIDIANEGLDDFRAVWCPSSGIKSKLHSTTDESVVIDVDATVEVNGPTSSFATFRPSGSPLFSSSVHTSVAAWEHLRDFKKLYQYSHIGDLSYSPNAPLVVPDNATDLPNVAKSGTNTTTGGTGGLYALCNLSATSGVIVTLKVTVKVTVDGAEVTGYGVQSFTNSGTKISTYPEISTITSKVPITWGIKDVDGIKFVGTFGTAPSVDDSNVTGSSKVVTAVAQPGDTPSYSGAPAASTPPGSSSRVGNDAPLILTPIISSPKN